MNYQEALKYTMDLCSRQEKCCSEIRVKLEKHMVQPELIDKVLNKLITEGFIDEKRFAGMFARDKLRFNKWGKIKIRHMLSGKKIPEDIIIGSINDIDDASYREILKGELLKKIQHVRGGNSFEIRKKLARFAQQRGFESGLVYQLLDEIERE